MGRRNKTCQGLDRSLRKNFLADLSSRISEKFGESLPSTSRIFEPANSDAKGVLRHVVPCRESSEGSDVPSLLPAKAELVAA